MQTFNTPMATVSVSRPRRPRYSGTIDHRRVRCGNAISEASEVATTHEGYRYVQTVLNQVLLHQSIIGLESKQAMEMLDEYPDIVIGCAGGGSNLGGLISPFMQDKLLGKADPRIIAVEPASCPSAYPRQVCFTISAIPAMLRRWPACTRSATASCPRPTTQAVCVITA